MRDKLGEKLADWFELHCETICNPTWWYLLIIIATIIALLIWEPK